ncbi:TonB-dependent receptor [Thermodesulfobacteriota bacterium]
MKKGVFLFLMSAALTAAAPGFAENEGKAEESSVTMQEVVVTGTRYKQEAQKIPAQVSIITSEQIKASGAQTVPDALRSLVGVVIRDLNGNGNNQIVDMGGFGETADRHVAVVINGRRVNPVDLSGVRWTLIPTENIERIEVLHGSGSVLYGNNAVGGVINIITKDWQHKNYVEAEGAAGRYDTRKGYINGGFGQDPFGLLIGLSSFQTDGYRERSETDRRHFNSKVSVDAADNALLSFELNSGSAEFQLPGSLTGAQVKANRRQSVNPNDEGGDEDISFIFGLETDWGDKGLFNLNWSRRVEDRSTDIASWFSFMNFDITTNGLTSQYILDNNAGGYGQRLTLGLDLYETEYAAKRGLFKGDISSLFDHNIKTYGGYIQDEINLLESLLLNMGVRYVKPKINLETRTAGSQTKVEYDKGEWAFNVGLAYSYLPGSKIYGRIYRSYRYPVVDEYTSLFTGAVNTNLIQETSLGYEAGTRLSLSSKLLFNLRAYWLDVNDEIAWNNVKRQNENLLETSHKGGEFDLRYMPLSYLAFYGGVGYTNAEFTDGPNKGNKIPLVPEWKANAGLDINLGFGFRYRLQYNYLGERFFGNDFNNSQKKMDSFQTVDMYITYHFRFLEVFFNATNVFNEEFSDFAFYNSFDQTFNFYPMPEALYLGGIRLSF